MSRLLSSSQTKRYLGISQRVVSLSSHDCTTKCHQCPALRAHVEAPQSQVQAVPINIIASFPMTTRSTNTPLAPRFSTIIGLTADHFGCSLRPSGWYRLQIHWIPRSPAQRRPSQACCWCSRCCNSCLRDTRSLVRYPRDDHGRWIGGFTKLTSRHEPHPSPPDAEQRIGDGD